MPSLKKETLYMETLFCVFAKAKPFLAVVFVQFSYALMSLLAKLALNQGMSPHILVAQRMAVATALFAPFAIVIERNNRPKMTLELFAKVTLLSLFEPVVEQNLFYTGMKETTATFTSAMCNVLPAITFIMAWIFRLEKVERKRLRSFAKVAGTVVAVGGAMVMTFVNGSVVELPWTRARGHHEHSVQSQSNEAQTHDLLKGAAMLIAGCFSWSCFIILQAKILKSYPAELTLTTLMCFMGCLEGTILTLIIERNNTSVWPIHRDVKLLASTYGGLVSGLAYYVFGWVAKDRGPVFVSAFGPLNMVIIAILSSFVFAEEMHLGRLIGALVIVIGIYMVLWGKNKDRVHQPPSNEGNDKVPNTENGNMERPSSADSVTVIPID